MDEYTICTICNTPVHAHKTHKDSKGNAVCWFCWHVEDSETLPECNDWNDTPIRDIEQECTFVCDSCGEIIDLAYMVVVPAADDETADHADGWHLCRGCAGV